MIWPSSERWSGLDRGLRLTVILVAIMYIAICVAGLFKPGPTRRDMVMIEWARAHADLGLAQTKGYILRKKWNPPQGLRPAPPAWATKVMLGDHHVYVSAPPLYPLLCAAMYELGGQKWPAMRLVPILLGCVYLYSCFALSCKYLKGSARCWLLYMALSPMFLIYATELEINTGNLGFAVLSYLCFANYLETGVNRWMLWAGGWYLLAFWSSYVAASIAVPMLIQLLLHRSLPLRERRSGAFIWLSLIAIGFLAVIMHLALLPGVFGWAAERISVRYSLSTGGATQSDIALTDLAMRLVIRFATHFTPVCMLLSGVGLLLALRSALRRSPSQVARDRRQVHPWAVVLQFFFWGLPFGILPVNYSYVHPQVLYYFSTFFAFGSALTLQSLHDSAASSSTRNLAIHATVCLFLLLSVSRSLFAMAGGSLPSLLADYIPSSITSRWDLASDEGGGPAVIPREQ